MSTKYEWDHERAGRSAYSMAGPAGTGNKPHIGLRKVVSPVSGATLVTAHSGDKLKDPLTGFPLRLVSTDQAYSAYKPGDCEYNQLAYTKKFVLREEVDLLIQSIRRTDYVNTMTSEKVCAAGSGPLRGEGHPEHKD
eukprot:jgi/Tetstr1/436101/TSEL_024949.t1